MEFNYIADGIDAVVIDNFYSEEQLKEIMIELNWLTKPSILQDETQLTTAEQDGKMLSSKRGVFLENVLIYLYLFILYDIISSQLHLYY